MSYSLAFSQSIFIMLYVAVKIAKGQGDFISTQQLSQELNIPASTASMILRRLNRAGLIETKEGVNGGVRLAVSTADITLLDIFMAMEQERPLFQKVVAFPPEREGSMKAHRIIYGALDEVEDSMKASLKTVTLRLLMQTIAQ